MTVLVAGATGNTGRALVRELKAAGVPLRAAARHRDGLRSLGVAEVVEIDFADPHSLARALRGIEKLYLATPLGPGMDIQTEQVVAAAVRAGVTHIVRLSGLAAESPDSSRVGQWHRASERAVESSGLAWTHLRANVFMQNYTNNHLGSMRLQGLFHDPVGEGRVSYIDVGDIAATAARVLTEPGHENRVYTLTGPEALTSHEVAALFSQAAGREIRSIEISIDAARDAMFGFGIPEAVVDAVAEWYRHMRDGKLAGVTPVVQEIIRRSPRSFSDFIAGQGNLFR